MVSCKFSKSEAILWLYFVIRSYIFWNFIKATLNICCFLFWIFCLVFMAFFTTIYLLYAINSIHAVKFIMGKLMFGSSKPMHKFYIDINTQSRHNMVSFCGVILWYNADFIIIKRVSAYVVTTQ